MCIRDSRKAVRAARRDHDILQYTIDAVKELGFNRVALVQICLLYTSDAADERSSVDLGGRRIIKKKNKNKVRRR